LTADSLATSLTPLELMPSARTMEIPFEPSSGSSGTQAP
jgi:hypothetical protein